MALTDFPEPLHENYSVPHNIPVLVVLMVDVSLVLHATELLDLSMAYTIGLVPLTSEESKYPSRTRMETQARSLGDLH